MTIHRTMLPTAGLRRMLAVAAAATMVVALSAGPATARGPDPERLEQAGWFCFGHGAPAFHCVPDGEALLTGEAATSTVLSWDGETGEFWGTELLIHEDLYNGQPCPQDEVGGETGDYIHVTDLGNPLPYYVCHHFESPIT